MRGPDKRARDAPAGRDARTIMRIFYAAESTPNAAFDSNLWRINLCLPLIEMGHDVVEFAYDLRETMRNLDPNDPVHRRFIDKNRPRASRELLRQLRAAHARTPIDLFFSYFYSACVLPETIDEIRSMGIVTMNWYCNASYQLHLVAEIAPHYDWCLTPERFRIADYRALGARPLYCQMAAHPGVYKPYLLPVEFDVTFVGQAYGERPGHVRDLLSQGIDVRVWGSGWTPAPETDAPSGSSARRAVAKRLLTPEGWGAAMRRVRRMASPARPSPAAESPAAQPELPAGVAGGVLGDEEMIRLYSRSKINLGFSSVGDPGGLGVRILQVRLRDFEVPMSGGFYLVEYMDELEEFYEIDKEVVCYRDREELADKVKYYLSHDAERDSIRAAGLARARRDHTWHRRFESVFRQIADGAPAPAR